MPSDSAATLTAIARLIADAPTLGDAVTRLAAQLREAIPFELLHVLRFDRADSVSLYVVHPSGELETVVHRIGGLGPVLPADDRETKSRLIGTVRQNAHVHGALWLTSSQPDAFTESHQLLLDSVADLLVFALREESTRSTDALRLERLESLERLLHAMAESLDIRQVFDDVADVVRGGLPHDVLAMTAWAEDGRSIRVYALAGMTVSDPAFWAPTTLTGDDRAVLDLDAYIVEDVAAEIPTESTRGRIFAALKTGSALRVPIPLGGGVFGSLLFLSHATGSFQPDDIGFARHVAHHLALALSYQRLAEAARRDTAAREEAARLEAQVATLTRELESRTGHRRLVGHSQPWTAVLAQATRVAQAETTVLLTGESGTGKEVVARFIHHGSRRSRGPFVAINCAALPDQLLESELFGFERGAFTGAVAAKPGRIEQANGGVLFLDEVGEMSPPVQAKLLRVLEEREFTRLGSTRLQHADIRVIAATNRDLHAAIERGQFREDLYYRLGVFEIALPPLRDRSDDILELADSFLDEIGHTVGRPAAGFDRDAKEQLLAYSWPGNVRELRNAVERAVILADGGSIRSEHLPVTTPRTSATMTAAHLGVGGRLPAGGVNLDAIERSLIERALTQARHNKTRAAKLLGLSRAQLYSRIGKYGLAESEP